MVAMLPVSEQLMVVSQSKQPNYFQEACRTLISEEYHINPRIEGYLYVNDLNAAQAEGVRETALQIIKDRHVNPSHSSSH